MFRKKKQTVLKVDIDCENCQVDIFKAVSKLKGVSSVVVDPEKNTVTVIGSVEPAPIFKALDKLKKNPEILSVGPPKPKCRYCKYFVCECGIARFPAKQPTELAPMPPGWREPLPCTEDGGCCPPQPCNPYDRDWWSSQPRDWRCPPLAPPCTPLNNWCPQPSTPYPYTPYPYQPLLCDLIDVYPPSPERRGQCTIV